MRERKRNRLAGFDYTKNAQYFITICCQNQIEHFGTIKNQLMILNEFGKIARQQIDWLAQQYPYLIIHNSVVMPNHVHLLIEIDSTIIVVRTGRDLSVQSPKIKSISELMGAYKTTSSKKIHLLGNSLFLWQRSFYDNIVRNKLAFERITNYITQNPAKWAGDKFNSEKQIEK